MRRFRHLALAYGRLSLRERVLVGFCVVAVMAGLAWLLMLSPLDESRRALRQKLLADQALLAKEAAQVAALESQLRDQEGALKLRVTKLNQDLATQDEKFREIESHLVSPGEMPGLLRSLLAKRGGLSLVSLRSLNPNKSAPAGKEESPAKAAQGTVAGAPTSLTALMVAPTPAADGARNPKKENRFFRHGVEIVVQGSYADLLAYVRDLEHLPRQLLWQEMRFKVDEYPRTTLTLVVFTLSVEPTWLQM